MAEQDAKKQPDKDLRRLYVEEARLLQDAWACPFRGHPEPGPEDELKRIEGDEAREAAIDTLAMVEERTGAKCATCPHWYRSQPWVTEAIEVYRWREKSGLSVVQSRMSLPMQEAVLHVENGISDQLQWLYDHPEKPKKKGDDDGD